jgi:hypothetical protein
VSEEVRSDKVKTYQEREDVVVRRLLVESVELKC